MVSMPGYFCVLRRALPFIVMIGATSACIRTSSPASPTGANSWRLAGTVNILSGSQLAGLIPGARLSIQDGPNQGMRVLTDSSGRYTFSNLAGGRFTMLIEASGFVSVTPEVALSRDIEVDFALRKAVETP
jgi:hypothetical protein